MKAYEIIENILPKKTIDISRKSATAFAPINIALCKYWGKRNSELNLPVNDSLSIAIKNYGTTTTVSLSKKDFDEIIFNGKILKHDTQFYLRLKNFLALLKQKQNINFKIITKNNIPESAGLASSASGFAALILALNKLFSWQLSKKELSILARLGSGSAARSLWNDFTIWHAGNRNDGMDSFAEPLNYNWRELKAGILILSKHAKIISSKIAMQISVNSSPFYKLWPEVAKSDIKKITSAIENKNFQLFGETVEANALTMHAIIQTGNPAIIYSSTQTITVIKKIWQLRKDGIEIYFTQDAGANLILFFLEKLQKKILTLFPNMKM